jgi:DNA-directed RNA polymerase specialized sigma24 family protein
MARTDAELLIASRDDPHAFRELYDRWADKLLAYFYRRTLDPEVAGDLLAETFAVAFERRRRFRDIGRPGATWLYGIAAKELAHWFRNQSASTRAAPSSSASRRPTTTAGSRLNCGTER